MTTNEQRKVLQYTMRIVKNLFAEHPVSVHSFDHAQRVRKWAQQIAKAERADVFLCELTALLHDIGRVPEHLGQGSGKRHHELSYEMCREWFRTDPVLSTLSKREKLIILYSLRYHWNDEANKYDVAWILRDADKLDMLGTVGVKRSRVFYKGDEKGLMNDLRCHFQVLLSIRTNTARRIVEQKHLFEPIEKFYKKLLRSKIKPIEQ